jgi:Beta-propeller repeat
VNAFQPVRKSPPDNHTYYSTTANAFLSKLSADGSNLLYSTYFGGSGSENVHAMALDSTGRAYIAGETTSSDLPTVNPYQASRRTRLSAAMLAIFDPTRSGQNSLVYATYLSGSSTTTEYGDIAFGLAVDLGDFHWQMNFLSLTGTQPESPIGFLCEVTLIIIQAENLLCGSTAATFSISSINQSPAFRNSRPLVATNVYLPREGEIQVTASVPKKSVSL